MRTNLQVFCNFPITVDCSCPGPEHAAECDAEEKKAFAAEAALKGGVPVNYDDFVERAEW
ncbi:MAG TPA: hypothetical protein VGB98_09920 [Pyrinomonadaceae bacterium]|jgi:hypothetical protein